MAENKTRTTKTIYIMAENKPKVVAWFRMAADNKHIVADNKHIVAGNKPIAAENKPKVVAWFRSVTGNISLMAAHHHKVAEPFEMIPDGRRKARDLPLWFSGTHSRNSI